MRFHKNYPLKTFVERENAFEFNTRVGLDIDINHSKVLRRVVSHAMKNASEK